MVTTTMLVLFMVDISVVPKIAYRVNVKIWK